MSLFNSLKTAVNSTTSVSFSSDEWHNIDNFFKTASPLQLVEWEALTSNSICFYILSLHLLSELLHYNISTEEFYLCCIRFEATIFSSSSSSCHCIVSSVNQLSWVSHLDISWVVADEHRLVDSALNIFLINEKKRQQQRKNKDNNKNKNKKPQQKMNDVTKIMTIKRIDRAKSNSHSNDKLNNINLNDDDKESHSMKWK